MIHIKKRRQPILMTRPFETGGASASLSSLNGELILNDAGKHAVNEAAALVTVSECEDRAAPAAVFAP